MCQPVTVSYVHNSNEERNRCNNSDVCLCSSANVAVARSYLSAATREGERTRAVAAVSLAQVLGFVVGPALQAAVTPLGPGSTPDTAGFLTLDMYTAAGWINVLLGVLNFVLFLPFSFKERKIAAKEAMRARGTRSGKSCTFLIIIITTGALSYRCGRPVYRLFPTSRL